MGKVTRALLKKSARLCIAIHAHDFFEGLLPSEIGLTDDEHAVIMEEAMKIAERLAGNNPMNMGSAKEVINYFKDHRK
jgi:hypothetical protein